MKKENILDRLGLIRDSTENYYFASTLEVSPGVHIEGLRNGMLKIQYELDELMKEIRDGSGEETER